MKICECYMPHKKNLKEKSHMIMLLNAEKAPYKI